MRKLHVLSTVLAGVGGAALLAAPAAGQDRPEAGATASNARAPFGNAHKQTFPPTSFGGAAGVGGAECIFDNYFPIDDFSQPASQKDVVYPFYAEAASDFILVGEGPNTCTIDSIIFAATFFNEPVPGQGNPFACWEAIKVTIYEDISAGPPGGDPLCQGYDKGPGGRPNNEALPDRDHIECFPGAVVCEMKIPMDDLIVQAFPLDNSCTGSNNWEVRLFNLADLFDCALQKNHKYWIAIAPQMQFGVCGQTGIMLSQGSFDHPDMQIFELLGIAPWTPLAGNQDACGVGPPAGTLRDLAVGIFAIKNPPETEACCFDGQCADMLPADCVIIFGGTPQGPGTICTATSCFEACCITGQGCLDLPTFDCVNIFGGTPQGPGTTCATTMCPEPKPCGSPNAGDCCVPNGSPSCDDADCCEAVCAIDPFCCTTEWDQLCADETAMFPAECDCVPQACCLPTAGCLDLPKDECLLLGGVPQGPGTTCATTTCIEPNEACCLPTADCVDLPPGVCVGQGGVPQGPGTDCLTTVCSSCGDPNAGDCCVPNPNGTPGCADADCCEAVCAIDPFCCTTAWDQLCADETSFFPAECECGPVCPCPADLNNDGAVNAADLATLLGKWGPLPPPCPPPSPCDSDFNDDCIVNAADLAFLLGAWGGCP